MVANPARLAGPNQRQHPRADVDIHILYREHDQYRPALVLNISVGGVFMRATGSEAKPGDVLHVVLPVPGESFPRHVMGTVVWAQQHTAQVGENRGLGLKFLNLRPDDSVAIGQLVDRVLLGDDES